MNDLEKALQPWREVAKALASKPLETLIEQAESLVKQNETLQQRLAKAMEREKLLKDCEAENVKLRQQTETMLTHPDVRAAKCAALEADRTRIEAEIAKLKG